MTSPTERAKARCKREGWPVAVVEKWNPYAKVRQDMFGFADLVVLDGKVGPVAVQVTSGGNEMARVKKITENENALPWLKAGGRIEVWAWQKHKVKRGGKAVKYDLRVLTARPCYATWQALEVDRVEWHDEKGQVVA